jgi:hypothetical protein
MACDGATDCATKSGFLAQEALLEPYCPLRSMACSGKSVLSRIGIFKSTTVAFHETAE